MCYLGPGRSTRKQRQAYDSGWRLRSYLKVQLRVPYSLPLEEEGAGGEKTASMTTLGWVELSWSLSFCGTLLCHGSKRENLALIAQRDTDFTNVKQKTSSLRVAVSWMESFFLSNYSCSKSLKNLLGVIIKTTAKMYGKWVSSLYHVYTLLSSLSAFKALPSGTQTGKLKVADISSSSGLHIALNCIPSLTSYLAPTVCQICILAQRGTALHS